MRGIVLAVLALAGCELWPHACNQALYICGLDVVFADSGLSAEGGWAVTAELDGEVVTCSVTLPAEPGALVNCDDQTPEMDAYLVVSEDGSAIERLDLSFAHPDAVRVTVEFAGEEVYDETSSPEYEVSEPNGEGCGECRTASVVVEASAPD